MLSFLNRVILVTGHYGTGKTNLAANLAVDFRRLGRSVALVDMDLVNPYFRAADFRQLAEREGFLLFTPEYAGTNVELPTLAPQMDALIDSKHTVIVDVGGDDSGAVALGRYAPRLCTVPYTMLYVINLYRPQISDPRAAVDLMWEIERVSRLKAAYIVNNSHLAQFTTEQVVQDSMQYAQDVSQMTGLPLAWTTFPRSSVGRYTANRGAYPIDVYVKTLWQQ